MHNRQIEVKKSFGVGIFYTPGLGAFGFYSQLLVLKGILKFCMIGVLIASALALLTTLI